MPKFLFPLVKGYLSTELPYPNLLHLHRPQGMGHLVVSGLDVPSGHIASIEKVLQWRRGGDGDLHTFIIQGFANLVLEILQVASFGDG